MELPDDKILQASQQESFAKHGYILLHGVCDPASLAIYSTYALMQRFNDHYETIPPDDLEGRYHRYADVLAESMLLHLQPAMERATGLNLLPTYSYLRIYETGNFLGRHIDRPSCEISGSLTLGYDASELWPLWVESKGQARPVTLAAGDMLVYRGRDLPHWRERFDGRYWIQVFFHYVDAAGPFVSHKYDGRSRLGGPFEHPEPAVNP